MTNPTTSSADINNALEWLWLSACSCTGPLPAEECPGRKKVEKVRAYIRSLEADHKAMLEVLYEIGNDACSDGGCQCCNNSARKAQAIIPDLAA